MVQEISGQDQAAYPPPQRVKFPEHEKRLLWLNLKIAVAIYCGPLK